MTNRWGCWFFKLWAVRVDMEYFGGSLFMCVSVRDMLLCVNVCECRWVCVSVRDVCMDVRERVWRVCDTHASVCERGHAERPVIRYGCCFHGSKVVFASSIPPLPSLYIYIHVMLCITWLVSFMSRLLCHCGYSRRRLKMVSYKVSNFSD